MGGFEKWNVVGTWLGPKFGGPTRLLGEMFEYWIPFLSVKLMGNHLSLVKDKPLKYSSRIPYFSDYQNET